MPKCHLCLLENDELIMTKENHILPNCLSKYVYGDRDKAVVESISSGDGPSRDTFYGREVLQTIQAKRDPIHTGRELFCNQCDTKKLGPMLESKVCKDLLNQLEKNWEGNLIVPVSLDFSKFTNYELRVFIISILWRQALFQQLKGFKILSDETMEELRSIVYEFLYNKHQKYEDRYYMVIFTSDEHQSHKEIPNMDGPFIIPSNPELFFLGPIGVFIQRPGKTSLSSNSMPMKVFQLIKPQNLQPLPNSVYIVPDKDWKELQDNQGVEIFRMRFHNYANELSTKKSLPITVAKIRLELTLHDLINGREKPDYFKLLDNAYEMLIH